MIFQSFEVWWDSFAGCISIERSIDEKGQELYVELVDALIQKRIRPQKEFNISLIYDECLFANLTASSYFAVLSLGDFYVNYKDMGSK